MTLGWVSKGQNSTFSEHSHVAYQIKWNHECSIMVANTLPADPLPDPGGWGKRSKFELFQNMVVLHIKLKQGCGNTMPDLSDTGNFDDGQVEFSC